MSKSAKNKIVAVFALLFIGIAVGLSLFLLTEEEQEPDLPVIDNEAPEYTTAFPTYQPDNAGAVLQVDSKYLWEYGNQHISNERPIELETKKNDETTTYKSVLELLTFVQEVTNEVGEAITDESGNAVTEVGTFTNIKYFTEFITDENGEKVTGEDGAPVTEMRSEYITDCLLYTSPSPRD